MKLYVGNLILAPLPDVFLGIGVGSIGRKIDEKKVGENILQRFSDQLSFVKPRIVPHETNPFPRVFLPNELQDLDDLPLGWARNRAEVRLPGLEVEKPHEVLCFMLPMHLQDGFFSFGEPDSPDNCLPGDSGFIPGQNDPRCILEERSNDAPDFFDPLLYGSIVSSDVEGCGELKGEVIDTEEEMIGPGRFIDHVEVGRDVGSKR